MRVNHRAEHGKVTHGQISMVIGPMVCCQVGSMVIGPMVCCQVGSAQVVQQASVHASEGGTEKLLALCE